MPAVSAFLAVDTQWRWIARHDGASRATGLDYAACDAGMRRAGIETTPELWEELQIIELAARAALNEA